MKTKEFFLLVSAVCLVFSFFSCTDSLQPNTDAEIIIVDFGNVVDTAYLSAFVKDVKRVRLQLPDEYIWGIPDEVLFSEYGVFVKDMKTKQLFRFSEDGSFLNTIGRRGNGPGEYVSLSSCFLNESYIFIADMHTRKINKYTFDGVFVEAITFPASVVFDYIVSLSNDCFLCYSPSPLDKPSYGLWTMNTQGEKSQNIFPQRTLYPYLGSQWNYLYMINEDLIGVYYSSLSSHYMLNKKTLDIKETYRQVVHAKTLEDFSNTERVSDIDEDYAHCPMSIESDNWLFSLWSTGKGDVLHALYSKKENKNMNYRIVKNDFSGYAIVGLPVSTNISNTMVSVITDEFLESFFPDEDQEMGIYPGTAVIQIMEFK